MRKVIEKEVNLVVRFTEDELNELGLKDAKVYSMEAHEGGILLKPYKKVEIDFESWGKRELCYLIERSLKDEKTINEVVEDIFREMLKDDEGSSEE